MYPSTVQQPVRAGDKLDFLRYQSPVKKKAVPVGVVSPSIKDTLRRVYPSTVQQQVRFPVTTPRTTNKPFHEDLVDHVTESQEMSGKHGISCDCPACMTYIDQWMSDDASFPVFGSRDAEQRLGNNVQSWVDPKINQEGLDYIFGTRDAEQRLGPLDLFSDPSNSGHYAPALGPSTIPPTIKVFIERIQNGSFATHARKDVNRFNKLMKKYNPTSYWIKQNLYAKYADNAEKLQNYLEHVHKVIKKQRAQKQESSYIGRRIRKKFLGKWYSGIITSSGEEDLYHVKYDDGDSEDLDHDEMHECLLSHEENESIANKKKEANAKYQQRFRDAKKANVRTNTFVIIMIATCLILYIV